MSTEFDEIGWILWSGTVGLESPIDKRVQAALATDFTRISLSALDVFRSEEQGMPAAELGRYVRDQGLDLVMDPVLNWHPFSGESRSRFASFSAADVLRMSEALQAVSMTAVAMSSSDVPVNELAESFGVLCDGAADIGASVHLEFIPMTVVTDLATAWEIVREADRPNGGLLVDSWHFFRVQPDFGLLESIPGERIFAVQINDAAPEVRGTMWEDTMHRRLPGDGVFDLRRLLCSLADIGGLSWVGPEIISPETEALPGDVAARLAGDRVRALVRDAIGSPVATLSPEEAPETV